MSAPFIVFIRQALAALVQQARKTALPLHRIVAHSAHMAQTGRRNAAGIGMLGNNEAGLPRPVF